MRKNVVLILIGLLFFSWSPVFAQAPVTVRFGVYQNPPLVFTDDNGEINGFIIDIFEHIAADYAWQIEYVPCEWSACLEMLKKGEIDILGAIAYSPSRGELYDFTEEGVITNWGQVFCHPNEDIESVLDLEGKTIALLQEDIYSQSIRDLLARFNLRAEFIELPDYPAVFKAIQEHRAQAGVVNRLFATYAQTNYNVRQTPIIFHPIEVLFAANKQLQQPLLSDLNTALRRLKDNPDSYYYQALERWFGGGTAWSMPIWVQILGISLFSLLVVFAAVSLYLRRQIRSTSKELALELSSRQLAERSLTISEEKYGTLVENANEAIVVAQDGVLKFTNPKAWDITGYSETELQSMPFLELIHPHDRSLVAERYQKRLLGENLPDVYPFRIITKNGEVRWLELRAVRIEWEGKPATLNFLNDISERVAAEEGLKQRIKELESLFTILNNISQTVKIDELLPVLARQISQISECEAVLIYIYDANSKLASLRAQVGAPEDFISIASQCRLGEGLTGNAIARGEIILGDFQNDSRIPARMQQLRPNWRSFAVFPIVYHKRILGTLNLASAEPNAIDEETIRLIQAVLNSIGAAIENASIYQKLEEKLHHLEENAEATAQELSDIHEQLHRHEKLASLGQLAGSIGHELRNPLSVISNAVYYLNLVMQNTDSKIVEHLQIISQEVRRADKIISDLLNFARVKSTEPQSVPLPQLVQTAVDKFPPPGNISLSIEISDNLPQAWVDAEQIVHVLSNLITNAYQAMPDGGSLLIQGERENGFVSLRFEDSGVGIESQALSKIFEPLYTTKPKGIGLGLTVIKNFLEANGGRIEVESQIGIGSAFTVFLPTSEGHL